MIGFGTAVGPRGTFATMTLPSITATAGTGALILERQDADSLASAYNSMIAEALAVPDLEALVLLHDDVVIEDRNFVARIRRLLQATDVGVIGVVGASRLHGLRYWDGRRPCGRVRDGERFVDFGPLRGEVDAVDGLLMVLSRAAMEQVAFDEVTFPGFHGYDADYCFSCSAAGLRVLVEPFGLYHGSTGDDASEAFAVADAAFRRKWAHRLGRPTLQVCRPVLRKVRERLRQVGAEFEPGVMEAGDLVGDVLRRARRRSPRDDVPPRSPIETPPPACMACGAPMRPVPPLPLVRCAVCGLGRTWPSPAVEAAGSELFDVLYGGLRAERRSQWSREAKKRLGWIETWVPEGLFVEVGAATGEFVIEAASSGYEAYGVEPSRWAAEVAASRGAAVLCGTLDDWSVEYAGFTADAIALFHVLEHIESAVAVLDGCRSLLAPEGRLFLEVPNGGSAAALAGEASWVGWSFDAHIWHFTVDAMEATLAAAGFAIDEIRAITPRPYTSRAEWGRSRAQAHKAGRSEPNLDYLRVVARPAPRFGSEGH